MDGSHKLRAPSDSKPKTNYQDWWQWLQQYTLIMCGDRQRADPLLLAAWWRCAKQRREEKCRSMHWKNVNRHENWSSFLPIKMPPVRLQITQLGSTVPTQAIHLPFCHRFLTIRKGPGRWMGEIVIIFALFCITTYNLVCQMHLRLTASADTGSRLSQKQLGGNLHKSTAASVIPQQTLILSLKSEVSDVPKEEAWAEH